jgi:ABC-2 type transport system ATP-binding protein
MGYMPQNFSLYPDLSVEENLMFYSGLFGLSKQQAIEKMKSLYEFSGLRPFAGRRAANLSGGMKQKLALSCNLIHDPAVLLLDEPTTGVDPLSRRQFWSILKQLRSSGTTIVVSTPYMDEVELSDRSIFFYQGKALAEGTPSRLVEKFTGNVYRVDILPTAEIMTRVNRIEGISARRFGSSIHLYVGPHESIDNYSDRLRDLGIKINRVTAISPDLEDTFIQLMGS